MNGVSSKQLPAPKRVESTDDGRADQYTVNDDFRPIAEDDFLSDCHVKLTSQQGGGMINFDNGDMSHTVPTFEELVRLKAEGHQRTEEYRVLWCFMNLQMTDSERAIAQQRFNEAADRIASEFGKSKRLVWNNDT